MAMTDADVMACYNMSLKDFEHSGVHDLFKVCKLFFFFSFFVYISRLVSKVNKYLHSNKTLTHRPCPSSSLRPGKQLIWTRRGSC